MMTILNTELARGRLSNSTIHPGIDDPLKWFGSANRSTAHAANRAPTPAQADVPLRPAAGIVTPPRSDIPLDCESLQRPPHPCRRRRNRPATRWGMGTALTTIQPFAPCEPPPAPLRETARLPARAGRRSKGDARLLRALA